MDGRVLIVIDDMVSCHPCRKTCSFSPLSVSVDGEYTTVGALVDILKIAISLYPSHIFHGGGLVTDIRQLEETRA